MDKIEICNKCSTKRFDRDLGIVCGLTNAKPEFDKTCPYYKPIDTLFPSKNSTDHADGHNIENIRPNFKRAKIAILLIWIVMGLDVISIISSYFQYDLLSTVNNGGFISEATAEFNDNREMIIGILYSIVSIVSIITFIQWFRRAYYNLNIRNPHCAHSEGWAAGSWFVPIISLFRPYQIMKEMWVDTSKRIASSTEEIIKNQGTSIIGIWWTLWIVTNYVANYTLKTTIKGDSLADYMNATIGDMVSSILGIPLAYITIRMVMLYANKEEQLYQMEKTT